VAPFLANPVGRDADAAAGDQYCSNLLCNGRVFNRLAWINPVRAGSLGLDSSKLAKNNGSTSSSLFTLMTLLAAASR